ncbi:SGNH/GDSL hydrolase family protein [Novipirellula rosea]|uniref:SGNH/GDSL hydrolase family protein n=1 Tax=Novipirellula rosea TaxID=1031540 RepID=A0ABP8M9S4_9BACT
MNRLTYPALLACILCFSSSTLPAQTAPAQTTSPIGKLQIPLGPYAYETKPDHEAFAAFNPRKAPAAGPLLLKQGDRLAICGDSITEQKMYSRMIETYLTVCVPQLEITVRQYGWSGEKTDGFLRRMDQDCLTFQPTIATLAYGMNDSRYRPFDVNNGQWYEDHYSAIVRRFKENDVRVVVGSPGCAGKIASWVKSKAGDLEDHNIHLCALRDIAMIVAEKNDVRFADIFWPMFQAQVFAPAQHNATDESPYNVAGNDGIHPGWAGQTIMAYAFLKALGLDGQIAEIQWDLENGKVTTSRGHQLVSYSDGNATLQSTQYPFCAAGELDHHNSIRSGMTLVPFNEDLNRFQLTVRGTTAAEYRVTWGDESRVYSAADLQKGVNLADDFSINPFSEAFAKVDEAVAAKQAFETHQVKKVFHGKEGKTDFAAAVAKTEAERAPLADAIQDAFHPVTHTIQVTAVDR